MTMTNITVFIVVPSGLFLTVNIVTHGFFLVFPHPNDFFLLIMLVPAGVLPIGSLRLAYYCHS